MNEPGSRPPGPALSGGAVSGGAVSGGAVPRPAPGSWADRVAARSPAVQRSRARSEHQVTAITRAARRLIESKGTGFTTQELTKESGVALQTIYRHFAGKDQVLLAVFEEVIAEEAVRVEAEAQLLPDPIARLRLYITGTLKSLRPGGDLTGPRFITAEHWRLHQLFPDDMARATQPFGDLIERELRRAVAEGSLRPHEPAHDAWFVMKLITAVYHHYAYATAHENVDQLIDNLWVFCLKSFGGEPDGPAADAAHSAT